MDLGYTPFRKRFAVNTDVGIDFRALVAFLAAAQAVQPTARLAARLAIGGDRQIAARESLIEIFAPRADRKGLGSVPQGETLRGSFNPSVPISNAPSIIQKAW
ncbi:hypothetical protein [Parasphingopyxis marina]|uniref:Uncharacterized protein n=1 Tax=Parasphingopyxis marina TaxID=2761622 RepID=A0A842I0R7_9SPHN|nr:hypothetical protein [Parasphingopyxis marina]MBC2778725.1 hypothetical protein [Parasphingopyxis marina]